MGQYDHTVDAKGRTIIPAKYRDGLGEEFVVTRSLEGCLYLYPLKDWQEFAEKLQHMPSNRKTRQIQRLFLSNAMEVSLDKQGRILLPPKLREMAGIVKDIVFVGMMNHVEIWDRALLDEELKLEDTESLDSIMEEFDISL